MAVSLIRRFMAVASGSGSWFGFEVGFRVVAAALAGLQGAGQGGRGGRVPVLDPVAGGDDDHVVGGPAAGFAVVGRPGHWPASRSAAGWGWVAGSGWLAAAAAETSAD